MDYIKSFDFTIIKTYPIAQVIDEYLDTIYGNIRFGGRRLSLPTTLTPTDTVESEEMPYISALLEAYSDELNIKIDTIKSLEAYSSYFKHLNRQRKDYYSAETIRRFVRDTLTDSQQFDVLKEEIYNGIIDTHEQEYDSGYKRLVEDLKQAAVTNTSKSMLDSKAKYSPDFLVLDSPILSLKEKETKKPSETMRNTLFENIVDNQKGIQTIVIENEIPEINYKDANIIHFTKEKNNGRYGFLLDVAD